MPRPKRVYHEFGQANAKPVENDSNDMTSSNAGVRGDSLDQYPNPEFYPMRLYDSMPELKEKLENLNVSKQTAQGPNPSGRTTYSTPMPGVPSAAGFSQGPPILSLGGHSKEPIPLIPDERAFAQQEAGVEFRTFEHPTPPSSDAVYDVVDQGISGPNHMRLSMYNVPFSGKFRERTNLPLGALIRPFAEPNVPLSDISAYSPPRCVRCRAYVNSGMTWTHGGSNFVCNLCHYENDTPDWYYQPVMPDGRRADWQDRPELLSGTFEFLLSPPGKKSEFGGSGEPLRHVFVIDVTRDSLNKGIPKQAARALRHVFYGSENRPGEGSLPKGTKVAILSFARAVHAYRLGGRQVEMLVHHDIKDVILSPDVFVDPEEHFDNVNSLLDNISDYFVEKWEPKSAYGSALKAALDLLSPYSGRVSVIMSTIPSTGGGELTHRDSAVYGVNMGPGLASSDPVKELFLPTSKFYTDLAKKYIEQGVACDLFAFPTGYIDLANVGLVSDLSGGSQHIYPRYVESRDARSFIADLLEVINEPVVASECQVKVRVSTGLQVEKYWGLGGEESGIGAMDSSTSFAVTFVHDGVLDLKTDVVVQSAVLFTDRNGARKVRVSNLPAGVTDQYKSVLKFVDNDTVVAILARQSIAKLDSTPLDTIRSAITSKCFDIFGAARTYAGSGLPPGQLLMPTSLRQLLPLANALSKSIALGERVHASDTRVHSARQMNRMNADQLSLYLYPRIYQLNDEALQSSELSEGDIYLLPTLRARYLDVSNGVYLIFNGKTFYLYITMPAAPAVLEGLFGVSDVDDLVPYIDELPELDSTLSKNVRALCTHLSHRVGRSWIPLQLARQEHDGAEYSVQSLLVEDAHNSTTYVDFVSLVHQHAKRHGEEEHKWF